MTIVTRRDTLLPDPAPRTVRYTVISVDDHLVEPPDMFEGRLPARFADIFSRREDYVTLANDQKAVEVHVAALSRAATEKA